MTDSRIHVRTLAASGATILALAATSCSDGAGANVSSPIGIVESASTHPMGGAPLDARPAICSSQPWTAEARECGSPNLVHGRQITCADLALGGGGANVTLDAFEDSSGYRSASFSNEPGYETTVYSNTNVPAPGLNDWGITTPVHPDVSTMTVDAIIFTGARGEGSLVFRFDPPEFYVRNMGELFVTKKIELCGYRRGVAGGPPPG